MRNFAILGVGGYIAPRHLKAIKETGNTLVAALDPHDAVGILDQYFPEASFFTHFERFDRHVEKLRRGPESGRVHYVSICSPNFLHDAHLRFALRVDADAICEKPLVLKPWNLDGLEALERETGRRIYTVLQLRRHPALLQLKERLARIPPGNKPGSKHQVDLKYIASRGKWYRYSWKGSSELSGGVGVNIGIHFFDMLLWLFGKCNAFEVRLAAPDKMAGTLELDRAEVNWHLSIDEADLPAEKLAKKERTFRSIVIDGEILDLSEGFTELHTQVYADVLGGKGVGIAEARPSIELLHAINTTPVRPR